MNFADWERAAALYLPLMAAVVARLVHGKRPRQFAGCLLSLLWTLPSLLAIQKINVSAGWWNFPGAATIRVYDMPLELFLGWIILWGLLPQLALPRLGILASSAIMVLLDCLLMPLCAATIQLNRHWLIGELVAVFIVLLPSRAIAHWTQSNTHLRARVFLQLLLATMLFLYLVPEIAFMLRPPHSNAGWTSLLHIASWERQLALQLLFLLALPGIGAVMEFAQRGSGTPIPYDPPQRLVTSGIYRYLANPMQLSCTCVLLVWAGLLRNGWLLIAPLFCIAYSAGLAEWDEAVDLKQRFGRPWEDYRSAVHNWYPRWKPHHEDPPATLYIARTCAPCTQVRAWIEDRNPISLQILDAEALPVESIQRMRYDPNDGSPAEDGIRAMGRALEHLNLGWVVLGTALRLPGVWQSVQLFMDASGLGPRTLKHPRCEAKSPIA